MDYRGAPFNITTPSLARHNTLHTRPCSRSPVHRRHTLDSSSSHQQLSSRPATGYDFFDVDLVPSIMRNSRYGGSHRHDLESLDWRAQCTWLMATDQYLIVLARSCIGSFQGEAYKQSQAIIPFGLPGGVHGLSAQIGALRPLPCSTEVDFDFRKFTAVRSTHVRQWPQSSIALWVAHPALFRSFV